MLRTNRPMGVGGGVPRKYLMKTLERDLMKNFNVSESKVKLIAQELSILKKENELDKDSLKRVLFNNTNNPFSLKGFNNEAKFDIKCDKFVQFLQQHLDTTPPKKSLF